MSDRIAAGLARLNTRIKDRASKTLTIRHPNGLSTEIAMKIGGAPNPLFSLLSSTPGNLDLLQENPANTVRTFSFDADDLDFGEGPIEPLAGMCVTEVINGVANVFTVMDPGGGKLAWGEETEYRDSGIRRYVIHTQLTGTES